EAAELLEEPYVEPAQVLRPTTEDMRELGPLLDELAELSSGDQDSECFYRMQALMFSLLQVLVPYIEVSAVRRSGTQRHATKPSPPRRRTPQQSGCCCRASDLVAGPVACGSDLRRSLIDHGEAAGVPG